MSSSRYTKRGENPEKMKVWDEFFTTPETFTKQFNRKGGFKGTAVNTMYVIERLTNAFGPFGTGWGLQQHDTQIVKLDNGEVLVYMAVAIWYLDEKGKVAVAGPQWGGDYVASNDRDGKTRADDEAFKKAMTDGMLKCAAWLGIGADIHYGLHDDSKYLNYIRSQERERLGNGAVEAKLPAAATQPASGTEAGAGGEETLQSLGEMALKFHMDHGDKKPTAQRLVAGYIGMVRQKLDENKVHPDDRQEQGLALFKEIFGKVKQAVEARDGQAQPPAGDEPDLDHRPADEARTPADGD